MIPDKTQVVIIGGGIVGASVAYHLTEIGVTDICLIERHQLTSGTTWHAAGLVAELRASANLTRLARYSGELYETLEARGDHTGYRRVGSLSLALVPDRIRELKRQAAMARQNGVLCNWLEPDAVSERWPHIRINDVLGALYMPRDGQTNPVDTTLTLARLAKQAGAGIVEGVRVLEIRRESGQISGVITDQGTIKTSKVVLCAGLWSRALAAGVDAIVPLYAAEHFYAVTEPVDLPADAPIVRVMDHGIYLKPDAGRLLIGCFEAHAKPLDPESLADGLAFAELPFDLDHFAPYMQAGINRIPVLENIGIRTWFNGPESFTPDGRYILGETPEVRGLFTACGFNSIGIQSAGGVGRVMADWIVAGRPPMDLWEVDVRRFFAFQNEANYLVERTAESLGLLYDMHWPYRQYESARRVRTSPLYEVLKNRGACYGELAGWERANWYAAPGSDPQYAYSYGRQNWFEHSACEHRAVREAVALFDQTSFAKYRVTGPQARTFLDYLCTASLDVPLGKVVYCQWLNERGGIEADVTVTRIADDDYWVISAPASQRRDLAWLAEHASGFDVNVSDITEDYAVLGLMGPEARSTLSRLTDADLSTTGFPFATSQMLVLGRSQGGCELRATRITYVGALGWELYVPRDDALDVYNTLTATPIASAGYHAMDSLRIEKAYRHWGHDITDEDTPLEAGLSFTVDWNKPGGFIGKPALVEQKARGFNKRLALFTLASSEPLLFHDEPIWRNDEPVGYITSGAFGHSLGCALGFGYVTSKAPSRREDVLNARYEIEVEGERIAAQVHLKAPFDPKNLEINR